MSVLGNPILLGETDTFAALLYASVTLSESIKNVGGWYLTFGERASAANDIITINEAGHYKVDLYKYSKYSTGKPVPTSTTISIYYNSVTVGSGDTFDARAGDTVRLRGSCAKSSSQQFPNSQDVVVTAILRKVPAS